MKKESIIAIVFGIVLGGVLALVLVMKNKQNQMDKTKTLTPRTTPTQAPASLGSLDTLELTSPSNKSIVSKASVKISGKTSKDSLIVIQSPIKEMAFRNDNPAFSVDFPLSLGENSIKVVVYPKDPKSRSLEKNLQVYYLTE